MTDARDRRRAADLLPEERAAGSDDPGRQAEAILQESDEREADLDLAREHRTSAETVTPAEGTR